MRWALTLILAVTTYLSSGLIAVARPVQGKSPKHCTSARAGRMDSGQNA
jgi:hypothetical protein